MIIKARLKSLIYLLEYTRVLMIKRTVERKKLLELKYKGEFGPRVWIKLRKIGKQAKTLELLRIGPMGVK